MNMFYPLSTKKCKHHSKASHPLSHPLAGLLQSGFLLWEAVWLTCSLCSHVALCGSGILILWDWGEG